MAHDAIAGSEESLATAQEITASNVVVRFFRSQELQQAVIQSITHIRDISKVNLGLSAICNDLAAANLEHARRIDANHNATNTELNEVKSLTGELLEHLRRPREPFLLDRLLPALSITDPGDHDAMCGWLRELAAAIDQQYSTLQDNLNGLTRQLQSSDEAWTRIREEFAGLRASAEHQKAESIRELGRIAGRLSGVSAEFDRRISDVLLEVASQVKAVGNELTGVHQRLAIDLRRVEQQLVTQANQHTQAIAAERVSREAMQKALVGIVKHSDDALRKTISKENRQLHQRIIWMAGVILVLQIAGFVFLSAKLGLWS